MKFCKVSCFVLPLVLVFAGAAMATDYVDIGDSFSETGHFMSSWGPEEPFTHGGSFGGVDNCRAIWSNFDTPTSGSTNAFITLNFGGVSDGLYFTHLEGIADDGFEVYVDGVWVYTHIEFSTTEQWVESFCFPNVSGGTHVVEFVATGTAWDSWGTYGQVCFDEIWVGTEQPVSDTETAWGSVKSLFR